MRAPYRAPDARFGPFSSASWWARQTALASVAGGAYRDFRRNGWARCRAVFAAHGSAREVLDGWTEPMMIGELQAAGSHAVNKRLSHVRVQP